MTLFVPDPRSGMNAFALPQWWAAHEDDRVTRDDDDLPDLTAVDDGLTDARALLVVGSITGLLPEPGLDALTAWSTEVRAVQATLGVPLHLAVSLQEVVSLEQMLALAAGRRWPAFDVAAAAAHDRSDPLPSPSIPRGQDVMRAYIEAIVAQVEVLLPPAWQTAADGTNDAVAAVARAIDADPEVEPADARILRDACRSTLADLEASGITISGPRDALLWPVPARGGQIPLDVATDAALEVMLSLLERRVDLAPDRAPVVPLSEMPARALLGRLRSGRSGS